MGGRFDEDEIKKAVFECCPDRAPGPDVFSLAFFLELLGYNQRRCEESFDDFYDKGLSIKSPMLLSSA